MGIYPTQKAVRWGRRGSWGLLGGILKVFIFRAAKAADAESLRLLFIQLPILSFFFFAIRDRTFFTRIKKIRKNTAQFLSEKSP